MMKIKCTRCGREYDVDESQYSPGKVVEIECNHCGAFIELQIPGVSAENESYQSHDIIEDEKTDVSKASENIVGDSPATDVSLVPPPYIPNPQPVAQSIPQPEVDNSNIGNDNSDQGNAALGCGCIIGVVIAIGALGFWLFRSCSSDNDSKEDKSSDYVAADTLARVEEYIPEEDYIVQPDTVVVHDTVYAEAPDELESQSERQAEYTMGFHRFRNNLEGEMIHTDGRKFPFKLSFFINPANHSISNITYVNVTSGTKLTLRCAEVSDEEIVFAGEDGGKDFVIRFSGDNPYEGGAWWGDFYQDVKLRLVD